MKNYGYASVVFMLFVWMGSAVAETEDSSAAATTNTEGPMASETLSRYLESNHPCHSVTYETEVNVTTLMGTWYLLTLMCSSWSRIPTCDRVTLTANDSVIQEHWESLHEEPSSSAAQYRTTLDVVQPGVWVDQSEGHPVYLVLISWHPWYLVLAKCYLNSPTHHQDVFILSRYTEHMQRDLDMLADLAKNMGINRNLNTQYHLWSMCGVYLENLSDS